jgi:hypothetical protein
MARHAWLALCLFITGCAAHLHPIERGDWSLVWTAPGSNEQEVIAKSRYESELAEGKRRDVKFIVNEKAPILAEHEGAIALTMGTVGRFRLNEGQKVDLQADEATFEAFWTVSAKVDTWQGDQAATHVESWLYLRPKKPGKGKLKLSDDTWGNHDFEVNVSAGAPAQ